MNMTGFFIGLSAGLGLGLLFAPRSGDETRTLVRNKAMDGVDYAKRRTGEVRQNATEILKDATGRMARETEAVKAAMTAGKQAYEKVVTS